MIRFLQIFVLGMITVAGSVRAEEPKIKLSSPTVYVDSEVRDFPWTALSMATEQAGLYHFYSHGRAGELLIDGSWQDPIALAAFFEELLPMGITHLNIYGCEFAKGSKGLKALAYLEGYLGISIAASEDITGAGGDWDLEVGTSRGVISLPDYPYSLQCAGVVGGTLATDDYDGDGICNGEDLDDDNDGILDYYEACGSQSVPFTSLGQARAKVVKEGIYYFNLNGEVFSTFVDANGYVMVTIDYGDGSGSLPQVNALGTSKATDGRGILSSAIFAQFTNLTEVRISSNTAQTPNKQGIDAVSTNATLLNKIISFSTLNRGVPDNNFNKSWVGTNATYLNGTATCTSTNGTTLNANIFHPCGYTLGLHWIPSGGLQRASSNSGEILSSQYMRIWVRAAVNTDDCGDSDMDGIHNEFDLDSDGDGCPDALEGNGGITQADFISSSLAGGNTGPDFTGYATGVTVNLGNTVDANGVPTIVTGGQNVGTGLLQGVDSDGNGLGDACQDTDGDGFLDGDDADDDNDGILDNLENCMIISHGFTGLTPASRDRAKPNDNLKRDLIFEASAGTDEWEFNLSLSIPHGLIIESIIGDNDYARSGTVTVDGLSVNFAGTTGEFLTVRNVSATKADHIIHYSGEDVTVVGVRIYDMDMNPLIFYDFGTNTSPLASGYVGVSPSNFTGSFQVCYGYILDDLDKDGLINSMDLDSDGDGCPDAYEGEADVTFADLQDSNLAGGNSGPGYLGYSGPVIQNFPGPVDATGVPSIVNGGQGSNFSLVPTVDRRW
ncbi:DUF4347 domain-containing protein [Echinicola pacifica]|nr:DUF4347 domain-containing protein [Echinicola pacifica]